MFQNRHILITGASSGIGRATALKLAEKGAQLSLVARNEKRLSQLMQELGGSHQYHVVDLRDHEKRDEMIAKLDPLDGVVHAAGIMKLFPIMMIGEKQLKQVQQINYEVPVLLTSKLMKKRKMKRNASIVLLSSIAGQLSYKGGALYAGTKAALVAFAKTLALEGAAMGIRANCVSPGLVETPMLKQVDAAYLDQMKARYPLGLGQPEDVAHAITFLLSDEARWITGSNLILDGGFSSH